ncbi:hypothetical protein GC722_17265 [Auraticoccus sp. F435]|uniref:Uncharacterized protein n=1 Tax=Auraticoccus cholistanensis TaxID=2656650 RepID=A0A6A9V2F5_9ACTN|nr:hypothetical protein [Auraticoccus cholistanensis]MVA77749.1 hypothetical protein [Auraticoccus cholistanensis]
MDLRLTETSVTEDGQVTTVRFCWAGTVPTAGASVLWSVVVRSGRKALQLGCTFVDGELVGQFVFDHTAVRQINLTPRVRSDVDDGELLLVFTDLVLSDHLGPDYTATGHLSVSMELTAPGTVRMLAEGAA